MTSRKRSLRGTAYGVAMRQPAFSSVRARLALAVAVAVLAGCNLPWKKPNTNGPLELSGTVDARQVDVAFQVPGRIAKLLADEGDVVAAGQPLAELDPADYRLASQRAEAQAASASKVLAGLRAGARPQELQSAAAAVQLAGAEAHFTHQEVTRTQRLVEQEFVSPQQLDRVRSAAQAADARLEQARQAQALLRAGARREDIERAEADVTAAQAAAQAARRQLAYVAVASPAPAVVSVRLAEAGQVVAAGQPVLRVAELSRPWVRVYLPEADLPRVRIGQPAEIRVDGQPGKVWRGRLAFISPEAEFTPKTVETRELRVDLVYRAKVEVDDPQARLKIGMPADVRLERQPS